MGNHEQRNDELTKRVIALKKENAALAIRVAEIEAELGRMAEAMTTMEQTIGLDLMLAKIIIDHPRRARR